MSLGQATAQPNFKREYGNSMNTDYADQILSAGIAIIPVKYQDKRPDEFYLPGGWEPFKTHLPAQSEVEQWFQTPHNYGVVAGWQGLMMLDFDDATEYSRWRMWATRRGGMADFVARSAFQVQSSRGVHVYVRCEQPGANRKAGKVDIKFRGYVLGPGSIHPSGTEYRALRDALILPVIKMLSDILPAELLEQSTLPAQAKRPAQIVERDPWQAAMESTQAQPVGAGAIDKIKKMFRVEDMFSNLKSTSRDGRWQLTECPFHDDKHPSFWVDTQAQLCGCFSGCTSKPLDVINLYARLHGMTNGEAIRSLARMC